MNAIENILVVPRYEFERCGVFHGFCQAGQNHNIGRYLTSHPDEPRLASFMPRDQAETDERFLQVIPYCLLIHGQDIFIYSRNKKGGEDRLHEKLSMGVGGHINDGDHADDPLLAYLEGTVRELQEEVGIEIPIQAIGGTVLGLLHDDESPVGRVHLGILHALHVSGPQMATVLACAEESMSEPRLTNIQELATGEEFELLENWSQWALTHLVSLMSRPKPWESADTIKSLQYLNLAACEVGRASAELLLQSKGPHWMVARENLTNAAGGFTAALERLVTIGVLSQSLVDAAAEEFESQMKSQLASTQQSS